MREWPAVGVAVLVTPLVPGADASSLAAIRPRPPRPLCAEALPLRHPGWLVEASPAEGALRRGERCCSRSPHQRRPPQRLVAGHTRSLPQVHEHAGEASDPKHSDRRVGHRTGERSCAPHAKHQGGRDHQKRPAIKPTVQRLPGCHAKSSDSARAQDRVAGSSTLTRQCGHAVRPFP